MNSFEQLLVKLNERLWGACSRVLLGFLIVPVASELAGETARTGWALGVFLLGLLLLIRAVPAVARRLFPFSQEALNAWAYRRALGKRYDSYQWQKLLWIGLGMIGQMLVSREFHAAAATVSTLCLGAGGAGWIAWRTVDARLRRGTDAVFDRQGSLPVVSSRSTAR